MHGRAMRVTLRGYCGKRTERGPGRFMDAVRKDMQVSQRKMHKTNRWKQVTSYDNPRWNLAKTIGKFNLNMRVPDHGKGV